MSGHSKWGDLEHKTTPAQMERARVELAEALTLYELRKAREMTQSQLARALDTTQPGVSRIEHQTDLYLSTLRSYVEALGGTLELRAAFPDAGEVVLRVLDELDETEMERTDENAVPA